MVPIEKWEWFGLAGHFICADRCMHHLCTRVGRYLVSTVGNYFPSREAREPETIGAGRLYETFVFDLGKKFDRCDCGCNMPQPSSYSEIDALPANDAATADKNHLRLCKKWARK